MKQLLIMFFVVAALWTGCGKKSSDAPTPAPVVSKSPEPSAPTPEAAVVAPTSGAPTEADLTAARDQLTQVLRKFSAEKRRVPKSLDELVAAGYLSKVPEAPAGKKFAIDEKRVEVTLVKR